MTPEELANLRRGDPSVTEVCLAVGCTSLGSFSARFTELVGETPTAYRVRDHGALAGVPGCVAKDITRPSRKPSRSEKRTRCRLPSLASMNLTLSTCFVQVPDPDLALTFYRDALGLEVRNDVAKGDFRWIHADDLDSTFEKLKASGAEIVEEPKEQPWGVRDCVVRDPAGNLVRIDQTVAASS